MDDPSRDNTGDRASPAPAVTCRSRPPVGNCGVLVEQDASKHKHERSTRRRMKVSPRESIAVPAGISPRPPARGERSTGSAGPPNKHPKQTRGQRVQFLVVYFQLRVFRSYYCLEHSDEPLHAVE